MVANHQRILADLDKAALDPDAALIGGNPFAVLGRDNGRLMLGWVHPPTWTVVEETLRRVLDARAMRGKRRFIFCATGGWIHSVRLALESHDISSSRSIFALHSLDPNALASLLESVGDLEEVACVGISSGRSTLETVLLMSSIEEGFQRAGLQASDHLLWLSSKSNSPPSPLGLSRAESDTEIEVIDLTPQRAVHVGALFSAPLTLAFLLPLVLALGFEKARDYYEQFLAERNNAIDYMVRRALELRDAPAPLLYFFIEPAIASDALKRWILQLTRQALSSKSDRFRPKILVGAENIPDGFEMIDLNMNQPGPPLVNAMLATHACQYFVASLAYRFNLPFTSHDEVNRYKREIPKLYARSSLSDLAPAHEMDLDLVENSILEHVARAPDKRFLEIVIYASLSEATAAQLQQRISHKTSRHCLVFEGSDWNHHSYQSAARSQDTFYIIVDPLGRSGPVAGVSSSTLERNTAALKCIARASHESLGANSRLIC